MLKAASKIMLEFVDPQWCNKQIRGLLPACIQHQARLGMSTCCAVSPAMNAR